MHQLEQRVVPYEPIASQEERLVPYQKEITLPKTPLYQKDFKVDFIGKRKKQSKQQITWTFVHGQEEHSGTSSKIYPSHIVSCSTKSRTHSAFDSHVDVEYTNW